MKKELFILVLLLFLLNSLNAQNIKVMTYNIRYDGAGDTTNGWAPRKYAVIKILKESEAGIIGVQEALFHQMRDMNEALYAFEYVGVGRDDGKKEGEFAAILYDTTLFKLEKTKTFWLSKTTSRPSIGWDAELERICTAALFKNREDNRDFWVFNTHFDHMGFQARIKSAELILKKIRGLNPDNLPVILMGDFNADIYSKPYKILTKSMTDTRLASAEIMSKNMGTFNGFQNDFLPERIDFVFTKRAIIHSYMEIYDKMPNGNYPSDHFPVLVELSFDE